MSVCIEKTENTEISAPAAVDTAIVDELVARCDYYLALYVQQVSINQKLSKLYRETLERAAAEKAAAEKAAAERAEAEKETAEKAAAENAAAAEIHQELEKILMELITNNDEFAAALAEKDKLITRKNMQIMQLGVQNMKYRQLIERIKSRWYGRVLIWAYRFCCRIGILKEL